MLFLGYNEAYLPHGPDQRIDLATEVIRLTRQLVELLPGETKSCRVTVPDHQLSLAIGNKGQNVRLCAHLTGYNIDSRPESGYSGEDEE